MTTYRIVAKSAINVRLPDFSHDGILKDSGGFTAAHDIEIRSSLGDIWRLKKGTSFRLAQTAEGVQPLIEGENFSIIVESWHKSDTRTCHTCKLHSSPPVMALVRPVENEDATEYWTLQGDYIIHEFDERGRHFVICDVEPGQHVTLKYHEGKLPRERYSTVTRNLTDAEIDYMLREYVDPRKWSL